MKYTALIYLTIFSLMAAVGLIISGQSKSISDKYNRSIIKKKKSSNLKPAKRTFLKKLKRLEKRRRGLITEVRMPDAVYYIMTAAGAIGGFYIGKIYFSELFFSVVVGIMGALAPLLYLRFRQTTERGAQIEKLLSSMMILSNSYIVTEDFLKSVDDNINVIEFPNPFQEFLTYVSFIDSNIKMGLRRMETQVSNIYFSQWIDVLIMAQDDRSLKFVTMSVVEAMNDVHLAQREADTAMFSIWREYFTVLVLIFSAPVIFRILMKQAYVILISTLPGQALLLLLLATVVYSLIKAVQMNKPLLM